MLKNNKKMDTSNHLTDMIYMYIFWSDLIFKKRFVKVGTQQKRRNKLFLQTLKNQDIPQPPYSSKFKQSVYNLYIQKTLDYKDLGICLVENGKFCLIKNGEIDTCSSIQDVIERM